MVAPSQLSVHWCHGADGTMGVDMCSISWRRRKSLGTPLRHGASVQIPWPPGASMRESFGLRYRKAVVSPWGQGWGTSGEWRAGGWRVGVVRRRDERGWCLQGCNCRDQCKLASPGSAQLLSTPTSGRGSRLPYPPAHLPTLLFPWLCHGWGALAAGRNCEQAFPTASPRLTTRALSDIWTEVG